MNPHRLIAFVVALALATPAVAADVVEPGGGMAQTAYVKATERTSRGKLDACEMEYRVISKITPIVGVPCQSCMVRLRLWVSRIMPRSRRL